MGARQPETARRKKNVTIPPPGREKDSPYPPVEVSSRFYCREPETARRKKVVTIPPPGREKDSPYPPVEDYQTVDSKHSKSPQDTKRQSIWRKTYCRMPPWW